MEAFKKLIANRIENARLRASSAPRRPVVGSLFMTAAVTFIVGAAALYGLMIYQINFGMHESTRELYDFEKEVHFRVSVILFLVLITNAIAGACFFLKGWALRNKEYCNSYSSYKKYVRFWVVCLSLGLINVLVLGVYCWYLKHFVLPS